MSSYSPKETLSLLASFSQTQALIFLCAMFLLNFLPKEKALETSKGEKKLRGRKKHFKWMRNRPSFQLMIKWHKWAKVAKVDKSGKPSWKERSGRCGYFEEIECIESFELEFVPM